MKADVALWQLPWLSQPEALRQHDSTAHLAAK